MTQVIPLLLVAIGIEASFFEKTGLLERPASRAPTVTVVFLMSLGEVMSASALIDTNLNDWHEFAAFVLTLASIFHNARTVIFVAVDDLLWLGLVAGHG